jgi:hypothetical protein
MNTLKIETPNTEIDLNALKSNTAETIPLVNDSQDSLPSLQKLPKNFIEQST